ncbi:MAG: hypothetical protein PHE29_14690, partial [Tissierellia bacterium]|nr:hypothetical protein [Tissierellia bacterium]
KDDGVTYESSTSNTYTFTNLTPGTNYQIKVYVKDNNNFESTIYNVLGATSYTNPSINSAVFSNVLTDRFTITATAVGGTNLVKTYYYSKDNGATYQSSTSNTYTYTGLTQNTTYNVKVYVEDTLNYTSNIISTSTKTLDANRLLYNAVLVDNGGSTAITTKGSPDFAITATTNEGMYAMADDYGTSYYFRGAVDNNWVKFAGIYWRIVRVNGDNSVKLIYSGTTAPTEAQKAVMTGTGTQITTWKFNSNENSAEYVGYMYTLGSQRGLGTASTMKTYLENWYESNLASYDNKIADTIFCNDRSTYSGTVAGANYTGNGVGTATTWFGTARRLINASSLAPIGTGPSLICPHKDDAFTKADTTKGNGKSLQKVGLLTADEASIAGLATGTSISSNYLYTNNYYWLGSPYLHNSNNCVFEFTVYSLGTLLYGSVYGTLGVRAVVSLSSDIYSSSGNGTWNNPYVIN